MYKKVLRLSSLSLTHLGGERCLILAQDEVVVKFRSWSPVIDTTRGDDRSLSM